MSELKMNNIEVEKIENKYREITKNKYLGGSSLIEDFSEDCFKLSKKEENLKIPSFVLYSIMKEIADDQYERPVTQQECEELYEKLNPTIQNLFESMKIGESYLDELNDLINNFENVFSK